MCDNCVACNTVIARAQYTANDFRFEISSIQFWKQLKQMQTSSSNNIINIWSIYVIFAVIKCVWWILYHDVNMSLSYAWMRCCNCVACSLHERNIIRTIFASKCRAFKFENNWSMKISFHNIFCIWHRYNVICASLKCVELILQFNVITSLLYVKIFNVQQLLKFHNRITSKKSFWSLWKRDSTI